MIQHHQPQVWVQLYRLLHNPFGVFGLPRLNQFHRQLAQKPYLNPIKSSSVCATPAGSHLS